ncbi:MAG: 3-dehydroquinate synthase [Candidatus Sumerlaeia bacterium]|nr:3-dehydroquinate synthase [Candidatus Sumerlaeia bacterium]
MPSQVFVDLGERAYTVHVGSGLLHTSNELLRAAMPGKKCLIITDDLVAPHWAAPVQSRLREMGYECDTVIIPHGETSKSAEMLARLWNELAERNFTRDSAVVALGGGVIGDLVGFVAASFLRGIRFVQIPTTLLAMVDSSVGGKTGINLPRGKNLVGAFWQPTLVLADLDTLKTLPDQQIRAGMAEVVKYGVIYDAEFFRWLEENAGDVLNPEAIGIREHIVRRSVEIKADVVTQDEREDGLRRILNFGHTIGHAIEAVGHYEHFFHGEAISIGMVAASLLTLRRGKSSWNQDNHQRLVHLLERLELPVRIPGIYGAADLLDRTKVDKKALRGTVRYVLPTRLGEIETVTDITDEMVLGVLTELGARA